MQFSCTGFRGFFHVIRVRNSCLKFCRDVTFPYKEKGVCMFFVEDRNGIVLKVMFFLLRPLHRLLRKTVRHNLLIIVIYKRSTEIFRRRCHFITGERVYFKMY